MNCNVQKTKCIKFFVYLLIHGPSLMIGASITAVVLIITFIGFSGSCYKCCKKGYGTATSYGLGVLNKIIEQGDGKIELMEDCDDWGNVV